MAERIYNVNANDELDPMEEQPFPSEERLEQLLTRYPELLDGEQVRPESARRWMVIARQMGISERAQGPERWWLDLLIVDQDAVPTLVEIKRGSNAELRRAVVGQLLQYAAHAPLTWTAETMRERFEATCKEAGVEATGRLAQLLNPDEADVLLDDTDIAAFFSKVATNLDARRMRLLFVADEIPDELLRVVEFLNQQMVDVEVLAVAIKRYSGANSRTLVPQVLGRMAGSAQAKAGGGKRPNLNRETFLDLFESERDRKAVSSMLAWAEEMGLTTTWSTASATLRAPCPAWKNSPITIVMLIAPGLVGGWAGESLRNAHFGDGIYMALEEGDEAIKDVMERYVSSFSGDAFLTYVEKSSRRGYMGPYADVGQHLGAIKERVATVVRELGALPPPSLQP